jgi:hypothetical protein
MWSVSTHSAPANRSSVWCMVFIYLYFICFFSNEVCVCVCVCVCVFIYIYIYIYIYMTSNETVISGWWIGMGLEESCRDLILRFWPSFSLESLRKTMKKLSRSLDRVLNPRPPEYETRVLTTRQRLSVHCDVLVSWSDLYSLLNLFCKK